MRTSCTTLRDILKIKCKTKGARDMAALEDYLKEGSFTRCESVCKALRDRGFKAEAFRTGKDAVEFVMKLIKREETVGVPGSVTIREIGLMDELKQQGNTVYHHWDPTLTPEKLTKRFLEANGADWFVTGCNAVTQDGQLVNIDGKGNRISAMVWAPGKIIYIMGVNKICADIDSAIKRVKNEATPPNCARVNSAPPCVKAGKCINCNSPERGCRVTAIMDYPPFGRQCHVIMIAENLGY